MGTTGIMKPRVGPAKQPASLHKLPGCDLKSTIAHKTHQQGHRTAINKDWDMSPILNDRHPCPI